MLTLPLSGAAANTGATLGNFFQIRLFWKHLMIGMSVRVSIRSADVSEMEELILIEED